MPHLDEGMIHSWLDGALSADEAARVEAHVAECPQCANAVAEARGFIAASSRILTALDDVPRAVVPISTSARSWNAAIWRAAAAVLVVATGSLVVFRNSGREAPIATNVDSVWTTPTPKPAPPIIVQGNPSRRTAISSSQSNAPSSEKSIAKGAAPDALTAAGQTLATPTPRVAYSGKERTPAPQTFAPSRVAGVKAMDAVGELASLKVVGTRRQIGAKVTLYEVAPGDTVTLSELMSIQLESVVTTGVATAEPTTRRSVAKSAGAAPTSRADAAAVSAPDSQHITKNPTAPAVPPSVATPASQVGFVNEVTTINWTDAITGNVLTLSGRMPVAQLQQIRFRIQRERAAAAAGKKNP